MKRRRVLSSKDAARPKDVNMQRLEGDPQLKLYRPRGHEVSPAESRQEVIERDPVSDIDRGKPQRQPGALGPQQVVGAEADIKQVSRRNSRRVGIAILCAFDGKAHSQRAAVC